MCVTDRDKGDDDHLRYTSGLYFSSIKLQLMILFSSWLLQMCLLDSNAIDYMVSI